MQTTPMWNKSVSIVLINSLIVVLLASCASKYEGVSPIDNIQSTLETGDTVRIVTKDGRDLEFKITAVTSEAIVGEGQQVFFSEIAAFERISGSAVEMVTGTVKAIVVGGFILVGTVVIIGVVALFFVLAGGL